jgi:hypothetical protein
MRISETSPAVSVSAREEETIAFRTASSDPDSGNSKDLPEQSVTVTVCPSAEGSGGREAGFRRPDEFMVSNSRPNNGFIVNSLAKIVKV